MYVYKLDTGNRQPELPLTPPHATTKKPISRSLGSLLRRSKTHRENNHEVEKEDRKEMVQESSRKSTFPANDGGRRSVPAVEGGGRKMVPAMVSGRKTVSGIGDGRPEIEVAAVAVAGRRSAENRAEMVMVNVGSMAELLRVRVLVTDMPAFMQVHAFQCARRSYDSLEKFSPKQIALNMKKEFDKIYGPAWHCIVGSSFGSFVTHATGCFLYFSMEKLYILVFKTKLQKNINNLQ